MAIEQLEKLRAARMSQGLSQSELAATLGVNQCTISTWEQGEATPKLKYQQRISTWLQEVAGKPAEIDTLKDSLERTDQLKHLLNLLEFHLRYFRNETPEAREAYRSELNVYDVGYITSLLEMLFDEGKFQRWKVFTTHRFGGFRRKEHVRKGKDKGESG